MTFSRGPNGRSPLVLPAGVFFVRLRLAEWIMIARASPRRSAPRCWTCRAWHFGTFLFPGTGPTRRGDRQPAGGRLAYASWAATLWGGRPNAFRLGHLFHPPPTRVYKFRKYPLSVSLIWDLFAVPISMCKSLKFKEEKKKKNTRLNRMPRPNARPLKRNALTILAPNPPPTLSHWTCIFVYLFTHPTTTKKESTNCFKLRH